MTRRFGAIAAAFGMAALLSATVSSAAGAASSCPLIARPKSAELGMGGRKVTIIGWTHLSSTRPQILADAMIAAYKEQDCSAVGPIIRAQIDANGPQLAEARRVFEMLLSVERGSPIRTIGVEFSPDELAKSAHNQDMIERALKAIGSRCGDADPRLAAMLADFRLVLQSPATVFALARPAVRIDGYEDGAIKQRYVRAAVEADRIGTFTTAEVTPEGSRLFATIREGAPITPELSEKILAETRTAELRARMARLLDYMREIFDGVEVRNDAIARHIAATQGSYVAIIGSDHVRDLAPKLQAACRAAR